MNCLRYPDTPCRFRCTNFCRLGGIGYPKDRGGPLFLPSDLANLAGWYRYGSGITVTGAGVSQWNDNSGNANHLVQGTDAARPALQGDGSILFDGAAHQLEVAFTHNQPVTWYLLLKQVTWTGNDIFCDGSTAQVQVFQATASPGIRATAGAPSDLNNGLAVGVFGVLAVVFNGASSVLQINAAAPIAGDFGANNPGGFSIGANRSVTSASNIQVKEVALYSAAHDAGQRAKVIEYLARVGNITI